MGGRLTRQPERATRRLERSRASRASQVIWQKRLCFIPIFWGHNAVRSGTRSGLARGPIRKHSRRTPDSFSFEGQAGRPGLARQPPEGPHGLTSAGADFAPAMRAARSGQEADRAPVRAGVPPRLCLLQVASKGRPPRAARTVALTLEVSCPTSDAPIAACLRTSSGAGRRPSTVRGVVRVNASRRSAQWPRSGPGVVRVSRTPRSARTDRLGRRWWTRRRCYRGFSRRATRLT
jgi:hypothetical protein